jgi:hypothetical protein
MMRSPKEEEIEEARMAYDHWRREHENLAAIPRSREIFYHGYLTRLLEGNDG